MSAIIRVEDIGKKYIIGHSRMNGEQRFNEQLSEWGRAVCRRLRHPFSPDNVGMDLEEFWALRHIDFEVRQGDRIGLIGRNGSGKSTLLKVLSRITAPSEGRVRIAGRVASLLEVGTGFHPDLTGRENIFLNGAILGMTKKEIRKKFDEIVDFSGVERFLDTPVKRYSSGMYVRLAFSVAAHLEPEILIVDEVLAVGDSEFQKKCIGKMEDISQSEGRTILFVSHNMGAVQMLCNRGVMLRNGQLVFDGEIGEAVRLYTEDHKQLEHVPLSERRDRCGDGFIRFTGYTLFNGDGEETNTIQLGTPVVIETRFECEEACSGDIQIETGFSPVGGLNTMRVTLRDLGVQPSFRKGENRVTFTIPKFPLAPGRYSLNLYASRSNETCDDVRFAGPLQVMPGAFNNPARINDETHCLFLTEYSAVCETP
ncbi:ABC transporter ATP-binding protein [Victivallis vadensis]|uniref:ABC transporter ATP-binding protein n=1 Tax=Victivallis vadensis TaxID=172901 RepID=UPI00266C7808|nr:ABC transporter ATP-binding protein [Victivallis vadensis]